MQAAGADIVWTILGGLVTLAIFSFLRRNQQWGDMQRKGFEEEKRDEKDADEHLEATKETDVRQT